MIVEAYGGGTTLGAIQVYPAQQLKNKYNMPDMVLGNSIGAITACMRSMDQLNKLKDTWSTINKQSQFQKFRYRSILELFGGLGNVDGFYSLDPLKALLVENKINPKQFKCDVYVTAVNFLNKQYEQIHLNSLNESDCQEAIIASCTQYPLHSMGWFKNQPYIDGGARHIIPFLNIHQYKDCNMLSIISCQPIARPNLDNHITKQQIHPTRSLEFLTDVIEKKDFDLLIKIKTKFNLPVWLIEPSYRPGDPFDTTNIEWKLKIVGKEAWDNRRWL